MSNPAQRPSRLHAEVAHRLLPLVVARLILPSCAALGGVPGRARGLAILLAVALATAVGAAAGAALAVAVGAAAGAATPALAQAESRYTLVVGSQTFTVPVESVEGVAFLPLSTLAEIFRATVQRDPLSGEPVLSLGRSRVSVSLRQPFASIDNRVVALDAVPRQKEGQVWVSADFVEVALAPALGEPARHDRALRRIDIGGEKPLRVYMRTSSGSVGTRITFELSRKTSYALRESGRKLYLTLDAASLESPFELQEIDSPVVRRVKLLRSGREKGFVIELGREFGDYEVSEGSNPPSLIVELRQRGQEGRPLAQAPAPSPAPAPGPSLPSVSVPPAAAAPRSGRGGDGRPAIVIDPGHGGEEKGASGPGGLLEKDVTLDVAQRLRTRLERGAGVRVVLTRDDDRTLSLAERTALANHHDAELFLSIHANASRKQDAAGAETYFLSYQATDAEALALAAMENEPGGGGAASAPRADLRMVLWDLAQAEHLRESSTLAEVIQAELNALLGLRDRGVKQAPFRVLMGATMPAVLIELGFITNPDEEDKLRSPAYRESLALAISESVARFRSDVEKRAAAPGGARPGSSP